MQTEWPFHKCLQDKNFSRYSTIALRCAIYHQAIECGRDVESVTISEGNVDERGNSYSKTSRGCRSSAIVAARKDFLSLGAVEGITVSDPVNRWLLAGR